MRKHLHVAGRCVEGWPGWPQESTGELPLTHADSFSFGSVPLISASSSDTKVLPPQQHRTDLLGDHERELRQARDAGIPPPDELAEVQRHVGVGHRGLISCSSAHWRFVTVRTGWPNTTKSRSVTW